MRTVAFSTLGCKVNQVETEQIKEDFVSRGYKLVDFSQSADVYIINTCTVTHVSDRKSRAVIRRAFRQNPDAVIAVTGCLAQINPKELSMMENVSLIVGNNKKHLIAQLVDEFDKSQPRPVIITDAIKIEDRPLMGLYTLHHKRTRGFVKIEDGCENFCSYCIVPFARGPVRSKPPEEVLQEINNMVSLGYREIVLTGINTGLYGKDLSGWDLERLLEHILGKVSDGYRLRLSSIEPLEITPGIIEMAAGKNQICRHFHIPLQSGSDQILLHMGRKYTSQYYRDLVRNIYRQIPDVAVTTDVMVGFPGETETNFNETFKLLQELPIYNMHVFKYSRRSGTPAAEMSDQVDEVLKQKRSTRLLNLAEEKRRAFIKSQEGKILTVLVERKGKQGIFSGITDNYINIQFAAGQNCKPGQFASVKVKDSGNTAQGELIGKD